jgi:NADPH:quinone reductase-like Zn-dependent oxidoreductase
MITTEAWVLHAGPGSPTPGTLVRESYSFKDIADDEVLAEPIYGCWEANMAHAISRWPVDVCRQRGEERVVLGNAGVVRILRTGGAVDTVREGDLCVLVSVGIWDRYGYPLKILAYDAPGTMGVLAKRIKLHASQVYPISPDTRHALEQWAAFPIRYATAWDNWKVAYGAWRLQMDEKDGGAAHVWAWGGGVSLAELLLAKSYGCHTALIASDDKRIELCRSLGITAIDRRRFPDLSYDEKKFRADLGYRKRYMRSETTFLGLVKEHTGGAGVSIFIDNIGGPVFRATGKALARQGVITTCGWKEGTDLAISRAAECVNRHIHVYTHGARHTHEAVHYAEKHGWLAPAPEQVYAWDDVPDLVRDYADGKVSTYFPIFKVNEL